MAWLSMLVPLVRTQDGHDVTAEHPRGVELEEVSCNVEVCGKGVVAQHPAHFTKP